MLPTSTVIPLMCIRAFKTHDLPGNRVVKLGTNAFNLVTKNLKE